MNGSFIHRLLWGLIIAAIGVLFLLKQIGVMNFAIRDLFSTYWPVFLIVFGIQHFFAGGCCTRGSVLRGAVMTGIGSLFLIRNLGWFDWSLGDILRYAWPSALILFGLTLIIKPRSKSGRGPSEEWSEYPFPAPEKHPAQPGGELPVPPAPPLHPNPFDPEILAKEQEAPRPAGRVNLSKESPAALPKKNHSERVEWWNSDPGVQTRSGFIGDIHLGQDYWELKPMNISHFIGDTVLDLTKAQIPHGETKIAISSFIGDVKVFIPNDYEVGIHVISSAFLGDASVLEQREGGLFKNMNVETPYYGETEKKIRLVVSTFIGDVRVTKVG